AASAAGISRKLAAFHLDRLVEKRLLTASYGHPLGRPKDQAGRTSKLYEPTDVAIQITLPERRYDLLAQTLAEAVTSGGTEAVACEVARRKGTALARDAAGGREQALDAAVSLLNDTGTNQYEQRGRPCGCGTAPSRTWQATAPSWFAT
ncbi:MAG: hypothetical protein M3P18_24960, partial [Actinomycetota bacterium]|nr:hypothetical protein [Actinomycetota bacterium]